MFMCMCMHAGLVQQALESALPSRQHSTVSTTCRTGLLSLLLFFVDHLPATCLSPVICTTHPS